MWGMQIWQLSQLIDDGKVSRLASRLPIKTPSPPMGNPIRLLDRSSTAQVRKQALHRLGWASFTWLVTKHCLGTLAGKWSDRVAMFCYKFALGIDGIAVGIQKPFRSIGSLSGV